MMIAPARRAALAFLHRDAWLRDDWDELIERAIRDHALDDPRDRRLFTHLVSGTVRLKARLDDRIRRLTKRQHFDEHVRTALRLALFQLEENERLPAYAVIGESVEWIKKKRPHLAAWTNAQLRNWQRDGVPGKEPHFESQAVKYIERVLSYPKWMAERWVRELGRDRAREVCEAMNGRGGIAFRWNARRPGFEAFLQNLEGEAEFSRSEDLPTGFRIPGAIPLQVWEALDRGDLSVQDEAAQRVACLAASSEPGTWVDLCAAPGGKTGHLAELAPPGTEILALDRSARRMEKVVANLHRLGFSDVKTEVADLLDTPPRPADSVLLDAPCTALGVLAENPDARWRKKESQIAELAKLQTDLLDAAAAWVKPGGRLIYSVCTLTPEETVEQRDAFLERFPAFRLEGIRREEPGGARVGPEGDLMIWPGRGEGSGMYAVRFQRMDP
ncbi:hypothetical protein H8E52_01125 [bacterium]|nr:hypothetical protein [bacterium]